MKENNPIHLKRTLHKNPTLYEFGIQSEKKIRWICGTHLQSEPVFEQQNIQEQTEDSTNQNSVSTSKTNKRTSVKVPLIILVILAGLIVILLFARGKSGLGGSASASVSKQVRADHVSTESDNGQTEKGASADEPSEVYISSNMEAGTLTEAGISDADPDDNEEDLIWVEDDLANFLGRNTEELRQFLEIEEKYFYLPGTHFAKNGWMRFYTAPDQTVTGIEIYYRSRSDTYPGADFTFQDSLFMAGIEVRDKDEMDGQDTVIRKMEDSGFRDIHIVDGDGGFMQTDAVICGSLDDLNLQVGCIEGKAVGVSIFNEEYKETHTEHPPSVTESVELTEFVSNDIFELRDCVGYCDDTSYAVSENESWYRYQQKLRDSILNYVAREDGKVLLIEAEAYSGMSLDSRKADLDYSFFGIRMGDSKDFATARMEELWPDWQLSEDGYTYTNKYYGQSFSISFYNDVVSGMHFGTGDIMYIHNSFFA